jgi:PAS domain S-box-containing protein
LDLKFRWPDLSDSYKLALVVALTALSLVFAAYFRVLKAEASYYADFFFLPILLACFWFHFRGLLVVFLISFTMLLSDILVESGALLLQDILRTVIYFGIGLVVAFLGLQMTFMQRQLRVSIEELDDRVRARTAELEDELHARVAAQSALAEEKEKLSVTLQSIGDAVLVTDTEGKVVLLNPVAQRLTGRDQPSAIGRPAAEMLDLVDSQGRQVDDPIFMVLSTGQPCHVPGDTVLLRPDGARILINDSASPIIRDGHLVGVVMVFTDVTEKERMREDAARVQKLRSMELLAGGVAHDFNNITTIISSNIHLARNAASQQEAAQFLDEAEKASERAKELTKQLTSYARTGTPVMESTHIGPLLKETAELHLTGSRVERSYDIAPDLDQVGMEAVKVSQVVSNLVVNAVEAMPKAGALHISARNQDVTSKDALSVKEGKYVRIEVEDTGTGIPQDRLRVIFEPYYSTKERGSGLGLAIVQAIVLKHGGSIVVSSHEGVGTTFTILLPSAGEGMEYAGKRLLIISPDPSLRLSAADVLGRAGHIVVQVGSAEGALGLYREALDGERFAAVVIDAQVPSLEPLLNDLRGMDIEVRTAAFNVPAGEGWKMARLGLWGWTEDPIDPDRLRIMVAGVLEG